MNDVDTTEHIFRTLKEVVIKNKKHGNHNVRACLSIVEVAVMLYEISGPDFSQVYEPSKEAINKLVRKVARVRDSNNYTAHDYMICRVLNDTFKKLCTMERWYMDK